MHKAYIVTLLTLAILASSCVETSTTGRLAVVLAPSSDPRTKSYVEGQELASTPQAFLHPGYPASSRMPRGIVLSAWHYPQSGEESEYFHAKVFSKAPDGVWHATPAVYWPMGGRLDFMGYSADEPLPESAVAWGRGVSTERMTVDVDSTHTQDDILFAYVAPRASLEGTPVEMVFKHAQAWLQFVLHAKDASVEDVVTLHKVVFDDVYTQGRLEVTRPFGLEAEGIWTYRFDERYDKIVDDVTGIYGTTMKVQNKYLDMLLPEQKMKGFTLFYTLDGGDIMLEYHYILPSGDTWEMGKKYIYDITFSPHQIEIVPSVIDWSAVSGNVNIVQ